ncbi:MAG: AAA family ATPase [Anaerolineaceae bacterium]|nr:AAA family ATPase [Anaerolineaceae bacterium]
MQTKLFRPSLRPSLIIRSPLIERLNAGLDHARLTLISAPAGFGKTTLATTWLNTLTARHTNIGWLSLDENDNDPIRFLSYLIAALQTAVPSIGETAVQLLQSPQPPPADTILTLLINDISQQVQPLILVLDDYHVVAETAVHQALAFLLEHLPPQLHLLITTRSDPALSLSKLRARGQMVEIRANDLRFTFDETQLFFNQVMGLPLSNEEMAALERRTEGWIAGLQLAALSLNGRTDQAERIAAFTGSHRFIIDYLTEEVLNHQTEPVREFLLATSILERICGPLGDALTQSTAGQEILEYLEYSNLFLIPLDEERRWYRYHQLFAEVLQQRLQQTQAARLPVLHHRASEWLNQNGLAHEAINHALAGQDFEQAARLIERIHSVKWQTGEIKTLQSWLAVLPAAAWQTHPRLWLVQAWAAMTVGDFVVGDEKLKGAENALALLDEATARSLSPEVLAFRACYASLVADPQAVALAQQALQVLPKDYWLRGMLVIFLGNAYYAIGDLAAAEEALKQAPRASSAQSLPETHPHQIHLLAFESMIKLAQGKLETAVSLVNQALAVAEPGGIPIPFVGTLMAYIAASLILYDRNELKQVKAYLERCFTQAVSFGSHEIQVFALSGLLRLSLAKDDLLAAENYSDQINSLLQSHTFINSITAYVDYHQFQLLLKQNNITAAAAWVESHAEQPGPLNAYALHRLALPQLLIYRGDFRLALDALETLILEAGRMNHGRMLLQALILKAKVLYQADQKNEALTTLGQAIMLAWPEGFIRPFVDGGDELRRLLIAYRAQYIEPRTPGDDMLAYIHHLLAAFPLPGSQPSPSLYPFLDPLSDRELEVLRLVADGASNRDIADDMFLAVTTVKKHLSNIMSKLNASSRTQAVAEARTLGLL